VGDKGWLNTEQQADLDEFIVLTGYLGDNELSQLMQGARAMLFTSIYEGFGLPVLESMAAGTPCILSPDIASAEIASETALYASGDKPDEWVAALTNAVEAPDMIAKLAQQAKTKAEEYTWERCAELTLEAYQDAIN
ncbi:MAG: glycosyltransferase, partial [Pseudomonadales bacterium]|nr:glycosyltransferase [Pseudomonadales bacterium]